MKLNCGLTNETKERIRRDEIEIEYSKYSIWHDWYAWRPVKVGDHDCRWLETIQRKGTSDYWELDILAEKAGWRRHWVREYGFDWKWEYRVK